jgi:hypothetical protein
MTRFEKGRAIKKIVFYFEDSLKNIGVDCVFNNSEVTRKVNILFLCILPSKLQEVIDEIKNCIPKTCIVYSFVRTVPLARLRNLIDAGGDTFLLKPDYDLNDKESDMFKSWDYSLDILESFNNKNMISLTNPLQSLPGSQTYPLIESSPDQFFLFCRHSDLHE